jgi:hypothetical protein
MNKVCQYATTYENVCASMKEVCIKGTQVMLQKIVTWTRKNEKRCYEWDKAYVEMGFLCCKLKTLMKMCFASHFFCFKKHLNTLLQLTFVTNIKVSNYKQKSLMVLPRL